MAPVSVCLARLFSAGAALLSTGCFSMVGDLQAGGVSSTRFTEGRYGVAAQAAGGYSFGSDSDVEHLGPGADLRLKATGDVQQLGLGPHLYWLHSAWATPYARAGVTLLEAGSVDGSGSFGAGGPRAELGMFFTPLVVSAFAEYDLRWTKQPNEGFVGVMVGIGSAISTAPLHTE